MVSGCLKRTVTLLRDRPSYIYSYVAVQFVLTPATVSPPAAKNSVNVLCSDIEASWIAIYPRCAKVAACFSGVLQTGECVVSVANPFATYFFFVRMSARRFVYRRVHSLLKGVLHSQKTLETSVLDGTQI